MAVEVVGAIISAAKSVVIAMVRVAALMLKRAISRIRLRIVTEMSQDQKCS